MLTILEDNGNIHGRPSYICRCSCGNFKIALAKDVKSEKVKSCGCLKMMVGSAHIAYPYKNYIGQKYGRLTVKEIDYLGRKDRVRVICLCDCGAQKSIPIQYLKRGDVKSCGCLLQELKDNFRKNPPRRKKAYVSM